MVWAVLLTIALTAAIVYAAGRVRPGTTQWVYQLISTARVVLIGAFAFVTAIVFVNSGITGLVLAGFGILLYLFLTLYYDYDVDLGEMLS